MHAWAAVGVRVTPRLASASPADQGGFYAPYDRGGVLATRTSIWRSSTCAWVPTQPPSPRCSTPIACPRRSAAAPCGATTRASPTRRWRGSPRAAQAALDLPSRRRGYAKLQRKVNASAALYRALRAAPDRRGRRARAQPTTGAARRGSAVELLGSGRAAAHESPTRCTVSPAPRSRRSGLPSSRRCWRSAPPCGAGGVVAWAPAVRPYSIASWLGAATRGSTLGAVDVGADAIAAALPASVILVAAAVLTTLLVGWGGGALLALAEQQARRRIVGAHGVRPWWTATRLDEPTMPRGRQGARRAPLQYVMRLLAALVEVCQGVPVFWLGGLLVGALRVGLGWLPPGGIAAPDLPPSARRRTSTAGRPTRRDAGRPARPSGAAGAGAGAGRRGHRRCGWCARRASWNWRAPHMRVAGGWVSPAAAAAGARRGQPRHRGRRIAAGAPLLASALVLVEYLFGWPGLGLLAYHAARAGDSGALAALLSSLRTGGIVAGASPICLPPGPTHGCAEPPMPSRPDEPRMNAHKGRYKGRLRLLHHRG